tara:strand:- start:21 stop:1418 length:1398 start_codon:yes stop_codon:yes gene_type:complete
MPLSCIFACDESYGIGKNNALPWSIPDDLKYFKEITKGATVIMGRKTYDSLPNSVKPLPDRQNIVLTNNQNLISSNNRLYRSFLDIEDFIKTNKNNNVFIIGGSKLYKKFNDFYDSIFVTQIYRKYDCDVFIDQPSFKYEIESFSPKLSFVDFDNKITQYRFIKLKKANNFLSDIYHCDNVYKSLATCILYNGSKRPDRTGTGTISHFGNMIEFDISKHVPVLTTKKLFWKSVVKELLWFLRGDTNAENLKKEGVNIWNGNSTKEAQEKLGLGHLQEGDCGANYSFQWRHFGAEYKTCNDNYTNLGIDQVEYILYALKNDKYSRRIFLSGWNPSDLNKTVLPPCHVSCQFYVDNDDNISCHMYQRSCDVFLGLPFNILSYTIFTYILAKKTNLKPGKLVMSIGDTHIYNDHVEQINEQLSRTSLSQCKLELDDSIIDKDWKDITIDDFDLIGYFSHPTIKAKMSV